MDMGTKQPCPGCGRMIDASMMERHRRFVCPARNAVATEEPTATTPADVPAEESKVVKEATKIVQAATSQKEAIWVPKVEPDFWIKPSDGEALQRFANITEQGEILNLLIRGERGVGKTTIARQFAAIYKRPFFEVHCGAIVDAEQWFGKDRLDKGETIYRASKFVTAISTPGAVVLLDELNRTHPENVNGIFGLLDWRRSIWSDDLQLLVEVAEGVTFIGTINEGDDYFGINPLDGAFRERFSRVIKLTHPPREVEVQILVHRGLKPEVANRIVMFAEHIRGAADPIHVSPRQLATVADEMTAGATMRDAVEISMVNTLEDPAKATMALEALQWIEDNPYVDDSDQMTSDILNRRYSDQQQQE